MGYIRYPEGWGSPVIALWEYNPNNVETVRINNSIEDDISNIIVNKAATQTEKESQILSRIGQGEFRKNLIGFWEKCSVTGCSELNLLVASHIKPWSVCNNKERLDLYNGLLLTPNLDRLFDKGFITFLPNGKIKISSFLPEETKTLLMVNENQNIKVHNQHKKYLKYHKKNVFLDKR